MFQLMGRRKHKISLMLELPVEKGKQGYEFQCVCPNYTCEKGILFNRSLINTVIKCPTCKQEVLIYFGGIQEAGIEHIQRLKREAISLWSKTDKSPGTFNECIRAAMKQHRIWLSQKETYSEYRPRW